MNGTKMTLQVASLIGGLSWMMGSVGWSQNVNSRAMWLPYVRTDAGALPTYGASVAVDPHGGIHAAYAIYIGTDQGKQPAIYAYCPANPTERTNWTFVRLGEAVQDVRLALDPAGRPRLMLFGPKADPETNFRVQYQYAECNQGWTNAANWTLTTVATPIEPIATREYNNNHYFAISPQGKVAFVYRDTSNNNHPGTFYVSCTGDCTQAANWTETTLSTDFLFDKPSLVFSPQGKPRLAFGVFDANDDLYLAYGQCNGNDSESQAWSFLTFTKMHGSAVFSLRVNPAGNPRLAFSSGSYASAPFVDHKVYYLWCDQDATQVANWSFSDIGLGFVGQDIDLALDQHGRPRVSYLDGSGLCLAWCNNGAETDGAIWQHQGVESNGSLANDFEVLPICDCSVSKWINGQRSCLTLDPAGNPMIGYDAQHMWGGVSASEPWKNCDFTDVTITRFASLTLESPPSISIRHVEGSLEITFNGTLESAPEPDGPWMVMTGASSPLQASPKDSRRFYRVRQ